METLLNISEKLANIFDRYMVIFILYFILINIISLLLYYTDKQKAKKHLWRIPESTLILAAAAGGSFGAYFAMKAFHHKTKHPKFYILVPLFMLIHTATAVLIFIGSYNAK